jgi:hypothetical protein
VVTWSLLAMYCYLENNQVLMDNWRPDRIKDRTVVRLSGHVERMPHIWLEG